MATSQPPTPAPKGITSASGIPQEPRLTNRHALEVPDLDVRTRELGILTELDSSTLDPSFRYRWIHKSPQKVARARAKGYVLVDSEREDGLKNAVGESPEAAADGTYTLGDVVLMKLPVLHHKARRKAQKRKTDKRLKGPERKFRSSAKEKGALRGQRIEVITDKDPQQED